MEVPLLKPDEQGELAVPFIAPDAPGHYERYATCTCVITIRVMLAIVRSKMFGHYHYHHTSVLLMHVYTLKAFEHLSFILSIPLTLL